MTQVPQFGIERKLAQQDLPEHEKDRRFVRAAADAIRKDAKQQGTNGRMREWWEDRKHRPAMPGQRLKYLRSRVSTVHASALTLSLCLIVSAGVVVQDLDLSEDADAELALFPRNGATAGDVQQVRVFVSPRDLQGA